MTDHVAIIGGSVAGLGAAIGLAERGIRATIVERDPAPSTESADEEFVAWARHSVTQFRQGHGFSARARTLLLEHAPTVVTRLGAVGTADVKFFTLLSPE